MRSRLLILALLAVATGCGVQSDKAPLLTALGAIRVNLNEIATKLEAGDLEAVDAVMHREDFSQPFKELTSHIKKAGLPASAQQALSDASDRLTEQLRTIHAQAHGGSIEKLDVPEITGAIRDALDAMAEALPEDWALPIAGQTDSPGAAAATGAGDAQQAEDEPRNAGPADAPEGDAATDATGIAGEPPAE